MTLSFFKYYKPNILLTLIVGLAISLYLGLLHVAIPISVITVISILLFCIDRWLWKYWPFSLLFWIRDFSGTYEGQLEYQYLDEKCDLKTGSLKHMKVIHQTGSNIEICSFTYAEDGAPSSSSKSIEVAVNKTENDVYSLIFTYLNNGNPKLAFPPHYGTEVIKVIENGKKKTLSGDYYTNRTPIQTRGKFVDLKLKDGKLVHPF